MRVHMPTEFSLPEAVDNRRLVKPSALFKHHAKTFKSKCARSGNDNSVVPPMAPPTEKPMRSLKAKKLALLGA